MSATWYGSIDMGRYTCRLHDIRDTYKYKDKCVEDKGDKYHGWCREAMF